MSRLEWLIYVSFCNSISSISFHLFSQFHLLSFLRDVTQSTHISTSSGDTARLKVGKDELMDDTYFHGTIGLESDERRGKSSSSKGNK